MISRTLRPRAGRGALFVAAGVFVLAALSQAPLSAATLNVGPGKTYATPCAAIAAAAAGDTILIDASGNYAGDVCGWTKNGLILRGVNGRPKIDAAGKNAQGKAIWVITGNDTTVDNIEFSGAAVSSHNGAAIRQEGANLTLRNCYIHHNEDGILAADNSASSILIENTEFAYNGYGDGYTHNIYISHVAQFTLRYSYSHHASVGHLVKSRAAKNYILYNRLSDEATGTASYEIDLPNGGTSYVIGNVIEQGPQTSNPSIIAYALEGATNAGKDLYVVNNTIVNDRTSGGTFVNIASGVSAAVIRNNIFYGPGTVTNQSGATLANNLTGTSAGLVNVGAYDYHLTSGSPAVNAGASPGTGAGYSLTPAYEYVHPACAEVRNTVGTIDIGAYELGGAGTRLTCGSSTPPPTTVSLSSLSCTPSSLTGPGTSSCTVSLSGAAPSGGAAVTLKSSSAAVTVPASVTVPSGASSAGFTANAATVSSQTAATLTAGYSGVSKTFVVTVNPPTACSYSISPSSASYAAASSSGSVAVTAGSGCSWTAKSNVSWITITSGASGTGSGTVRYSVSANTGTTSRSGTATLAGRTFTVTQSGTSSTAQLSSLTCSPSSVAGPGTSSCTVSLSAAASASATVALSSSSSVITVPSSVSIASGAATAKFTANVARVGSNTTAVLTASLAGVSRTFSLTATPATFSTIRVNAGGSRYVDRAGLVWAADAGYTGGNPHNTPYPISNTTSSLLYQTGRFGVMTYRFAVPDGTYTVTLKFAELYFSQRGARLFNVSINSQPVLTNFDIFAQAGGVRRALDKPFSVQAVNGQIAIQFTSVVAVPQVNAIEINYGTSTGLTVSPGTTTLAASQAQQFTPTVVDSNDNAVKWSVEPQVGAMLPSGLYAAPPYVSSPQTVTVTATSVSDPSKTGTATLKLVPAGTFLPIRVNSGGEEVIDETGEVWSADAGFIGGRTFASPIAVANATTPELYSTERFGPAVYRFRVPNGSYTVVLKFAEIWCSQPGQRVFNVLINGQPALTGFDIVAAAGGPALAVDRQVPVEVTNGQIVIQLAPIVGNPKISAIEILQQ